MKIRRRKQSSNSTLFLKLGQKHPRELPSCQSKRGPNIAQENSCQLEDVCFPLCSKYTYKNCAERRGVHDRFLCTAGFRVSFPHFVHFVLSKCSTHECVHPTVLFSGRLSTVTVTTTRDNHKTSVTRPRQALASLTNLGVVWAVLGGGLGRHSCFRVSRVGRVASLSAAPSAGTSGRCGSAPWGLGLQQLSPRASASPFRPRHPTCHGKYKGTSDPRGRRSLSTGVQRVGIGLAPGPLDTPVSPSAHRQGHSRAQYQNVPAQK